jgi:excisionase family DNA binding protein
MLTDDSAEHPSDTPPFATGEPVMTIAEAAARLKVSRSWVAKLIDRGRLPAFHLGRLVRVREADVYRLLVAR